jgi:hypothetical protein
MYTINLLPLKRVAIVNPKKSSPHVYKEPLNLKMENNQEPDIRVLNYVDDRSDF